MRIVTPFNVDAGQLTTTNVVNEVADWEPAATNLLSYPRRFDNAYWAKDGDAQVFPDTFLAPDGTLTAERITGSGSGGYVIKAGVAQSGMVKSIYLRTVTGAGKIGSLINSATQVFDINENWQRFDYPAGDFGADAVFYVADFRSPATLTEVVVWHAQLEEGSSATSVIPDATTFTSRASTTTFIDATGTLQTAGVDVARDAAYGYVDGVLKPIGLLLEGAGTNLLTDSEDFSSSSWSGNNVSVTANSAVAPDGTTTADTVNKINTGIGLIFQSSTYSLSGNVLSGQIYVKANTSNTVTFNIYSASESENNINVNLLTGEVISETGANKISSSVTLRPDGWVLLSFVYTVVDNTNLVNFRFWPVNRNTGADTGSVYVWGAQLEENPYPTSYIKTEGAQVTRAADVSASPQATRDLATYNLGDQAVDLNQVYKVVADPSTTDQPSVGAVADPPTWVLMGWSNQYRMFRDGRDSYSIRDESIDVTLNFAEIITTFAAIGLKGVSATLKMVDSVDGTVYDETISLGGIGAGDWWEYFFLQYDLSDTAIFKELPAYPNADISFTVSGGAPSDQVIVGRVIAGAEEDLGVTNYGTSVSILDYSTKERDGFGNLTLVPRRTVRLVDYDVKVPSVVVDFVVRSLERIAATPTLFIGDELYSSSVTFGVYRDFTQGIDTPSLSDLTIQVEGF